MRAQEGRHLLRGKGWQEGGGMVRPLSPRALSGNGEGTPTWAHTGRTCASTPSHGPRGSCGAREKRFKGEGEDRG